jgi:benzoyl-CoA reductase/2-hydroxyglutaryl-CoA dehydratase subunit BcrC/BadD/HgdB
VKQYSNRILVNCSYIPDEIVLAAGLQPYRLIPKAASAEAQGRIHANTCGHVKSLLAAGMDPDLEASGIIIANNCDGMRRLYDLWLEYVPRIPAVFIEVPKKSDRESIEFFAGELRTLSLVLADFVDGATEANDASLAEAIRSCNRAREKMHEIFALLESPTPTVSGSEVYALCVEGLQTGPAELIERADEFIRTAEKAAVRKPAKRVVVTGTIPSGEKLIGLIESAGGQVCSLDFCLGARHWDRLTKQSGDPYLAIAERALQRAPCSRMDRFETRIDALFDLALRTKADGVVYDQIKYCDSMHYDVSVISARLKEAGIPVLALDNDYGLGELGGLETRVQAFFEMI